jgi:hypothetical protein
VGEAAKSQAPVENGGKDPIICRVSTILLLQELGFHPANQKPLPPPIPGIEKNPPPIWIDGL